MYSETNNSLASGPGKTSPEAGSDVDQFLQQIRQTVGTGLQALLQEDAEPVGDSPNETSVDSPLTTMTQSHSPEEVVSGTVMEPSRGKERRSAVAKRIGTGLRAARQVAADGLDVAKQAATSSIEAGTELLGDAAERRREENERLDELYKRRREEPKHVRKLRKEIDGNMRYLRSQRIVLTTTGGIAAIVNRQIEQMAAMGYDYFDYAHIVEDGNLDK